MPGVLKTPKVASAGKRKSNATDKRPTKRVRSEEPESEAEEDLQTRIVRLGREIDESKKKYNNIPDIIKYLDVTQNHVNDALSAAVVLCRVFAKLRVVGDMTTTKQSSEVERARVQWLKETYLVYKRALLKLLSCSEIAPKAFELAMNTLKNEGMHATGGDSDYRFPDAFLHSLVATLLQDDVDDSLREEFGTNYAEEKNDIQYYTFIAIAKILKESPSGSISFDKTLDLLLTIESVVEKEDLEDEENFFITPPTRRNHALYSVSRHKGKSQEAWIALLAQPMDKTQRKRVLGLVAPSIAPWFIQPELLFDFLSDSYDVGRSTSLQALSGVFYLIQEKNLDYPSFYKKLYSLLNADLLHSRHRSPFFRLLDTFLASTHLPAVLVASFIKRLSRLLLCAPPAGVVIVVTWLYNILRKHPTCTFMIHREVRDPAKKHEIEQEGLLDPYDADEEDPMVTNAIQSSLWEVVALQSHYNPVVASIAKIISEQFTKQSYNIEDFLDHSYGSVSLYHFDNMTCDGC